MTVLFRPRILFLWLCAFIFGQSLGLTILRVTHGFVTWQFMHFAPIDWRFVALMPLIVTGIVWLFHIPYIARLGDDPEQRVEGAQPEQPKDPAAE